MRKRIKKYNIRRSVVRINSTKNTVRDNREILEIARTVAYRVRQLMLITTILLNESYDGMVSECEQMTSAAT